MDMMTIDLSNGAKGKKATLSAFLDNLSHVSSCAPGLEAYHAARATVNGNLRVGIDRRYGAVRKALKNFNVTVSISRSPSGDNTIRLHSAIKGIEIFL